MNATGRGALLLVACLLLPAPAFCAGFDIVGGPSVTSSERVTGAAFASMFGEAPADHHHHFVPIATFGWVGARNTSVDDLDHEVLLAGGGARIVSASRHWFLSEQLVATSSRTDALSSRFEFMTSGGWQLGHFIVMLRHVSNAHLIGHGKNLGETMLLAGVCW